MPKIKFYSEYILCFEKNFIAYLPTQYEKAKTLFQNSVKSEKSKMNNKVVKKTDVCDTRHQKTWNAAAACKKRTFICPIAVKVKEIQNFTKSKMHIFIPEKVEKHHDL